MKRKNGFIVRQIADQNIVVAVGEASKIFHGMIKLNESGLFIWNCLENDVTVEDIVAAMTERYDVDAERAANDIKAFTDTLLEAGIIE